MPCKGLTALAVVTENEEKPVTRHHLVLLDGTCGQLVLVIWGGSNLVTEELALARSVLGSNEKDVCLVLVAALEVGDCSKGLGRLRVDEVLALIDKVNTIGVADARCARVF